MAVILSHVWTFRRRAYERHRKLWAAEFAQLMAARRREWQAADQ